VLSEGEGPVSSKALDTTGANEQIPAPLRKLRPGPGMAARDVTAHQLARIYDAMVEIVAEHGYRSLKVRDVVHRAEVSTRAFYEHFAGKEDCFLQTYRLIARRATRRIIAAQAGEADWDERPRLVFEEFIRELESGPAGARLALVEAYTAGEAALAEVWRAERTFEGVLAEAFARTPEGVVVPPLIVQGMVAGVATVSRNRLLSGKVADLANNGGELVDWAMRYPDPVACELSRLDRQSVWRDTTLEALDGAASENADQRPSSGDRALILTAVADLAVANGYAALTAPRIRSAAAVSRRKFEAYFDGVEDCYLAALEQRVGEAMAQAARAQTAAASPPGGVYRAIAALCEHVVADRFLARVCLTDDFPPGLDGARARQRLIDATVELLVDDPPRSTHLSTEASAGAVWSLFHHHVVRDRALRRQISATLAYLTLAPVIGPAATIRALEQEQSP
jgi:AcrR family transcriptional regulator